MPLRFQPLVNDDYLSHVLHHRCVCWVTAGGWAVLCFSPSPEIIKQVQLGMVSAGQTLWCHDLWVFARHRLPWVGTPSCTAAPTW